MATIQRNETAHGRKPSDILDRQPPRSQEAEQGVLGSILLMPEIIDDLLLIVNVEDFYEDAHQRIFHQLKEMQEAGRKIDITLLVEQLKMSGQLEMIGGAAYLASLAREVQNSAHATEYAKIVREKSTLRQLIKSSTEILRDAYDDAQEPRFLLSQAEQKIFAILEGQGNGAVSEINDILMESMKIIDARMRGEKMNDGIPTHFTDLDRQTGGLHNSELIILAARPGMGKTAFALNIAENVVMKEKKPVLFVSLEMANMELCNRLLCSAARVNSQRLRNGTIIQEDRKKVLEVAGLLSQCPLFVDDTPSRTMTQIAANARRLKRKQGLSLIIIDYLQLIEPDNPKDPRQEQVAKIARRLKVMARELEVPVMCLAQLNRQAEASRDNIPKLSHLRESGAIEQDADVVMFVHREAYYASQEDKNNRPEILGEAEIVIAKQRNGPTGENLKLHWFGDFTRFDNAALQQHEDFL